MSRKKWKISDLAEASYDLDLAPMLALMVTLIPILLLSSVFVHVMIIESDLPQAVQKAIEENIKNPTATVQISVDDHKHFFVTVIDKNGKKETNKISPQENSYNYASLKNHLVEVKKLYPQIFSIELTPAPNMAYEDIISLIDEIRKSPDKELKFLVTDPKTNKQYQTDLMFPDVIFADILEG